MASRARSITKIGSSAREKARSLRHSSGGGNKRLTDERHRSRAFRIGLPVATGRRQTLMQDTPTRGGHGLQEHVADDAVAKAEARAGHAQKATGAEAVELLGDFQRIDADHVREVLGGERLAQHRSPDEQTIGERALGTTAGQQRLTERLLEVTRSALSQRDRDEARVSP